MLDFSTEEVEEADHAVAASVALVEKPVAEWKKRKARREKLAEVRGTFSQRLRAERESKAKPSGAAPRYDDVYANGMKWLDDLAGVPPTESRNLGVQLLQSVWKSSSRKGSSGDS